MKNKIDRRFIGIDLADIEFREGDGDDGSTLTGNLPTETWSADLGGFKEKIARGAFEEVISRSDTRALFNHNPDHILGRQGKTLSMEETRKDGLVYTVNLADDAPIAQQVRSNVKRGELTGSSFGFIVEEDEWKKKKDGTHERTVTKFMDLFDVGPVTYPAYSSRNRVSVRTEERFKEMGEEEDHELEKGNIDAAMAIRRRRMRLVESQLTL